MPKDVDEQEKNRRLSGKIPISTTLEPRMQSQQASRSLSSMDTASSLSTSCLSITTTSSSPIPSLGLDDPTGSDDILSEILEGVIDFQEKSPTASGAGGVTGSTEHLNLHTKSHIEKFLTSEESDMTFSHMGQCSTTTTMNMGSSSHSMNPLSSNSPVINTMAGVPSVQSGHPVASNVNNNNGVGSNHVQLVPRMNELLQV